MDPFFIYHMRNLNISRHHCSIGWMFARNNLSFFDLKFSV